MINFAEGEGFEPPAQGCNLALRFSRQTPKPALTREDAQIWRLVSVACPRRAVVRQRLPEMAGPIGDRDAPWDFPLKV